MDVRVQADGDANDDPDGGDHCELPAETEWVSLSFFEEPSADADYASGEWRRELTLDRLAAPMVSSLGSSDLTWQVDVPAFTDASVGVLSITGQKPFSLAPEIKQVTATWVGRYTSCVSGDGEAVRQVQTVIRDRDGKLLVASGYSPVDGAGSLLVDDSLLELSIRMEESDCLNDSARGRSPLAFVQATSAYVARIYPGQRAETIIDGAHYVVMSRGTSSGKRGCGVAFWTVYRSDAWTRQPVP